MKIRHLAGVASVVLGVGVIAALQPGPDMEHGVRVAFFPNIGHAAAIVGVSEGFFPDDAKTRVFDSGPQAIESLFAGAIDMAYVGPGPAVSGFMNSDAGVVILSGAASGGSSFVARPGHTVEGSEGLHGAILAAPQIANTQDVSLRSHIAAVGLETAERGGSVAVLNVANPEIYVLFSKGEIDAAWVPEPWATILVRELGGTRVFHEESLWPDGRFASAVLVARADYVRENPDKVAAWLKGHDEAVAWIRQNPDQTVRIFEGFMREQLGAEFKPGVLDEAFDNIEITSEPLPATIDEFARRADGLGYLGREGYDLGGLYAHGGKT